MMGEISEVITTALIEHDIDRIKQAVLDGDDEGLNWLRDQLADNYNAMTAPDLIDEFQGRGLELVARERRNVIND